jgi:predicted metal-dependent phosphoesterase TrpH
MFLADLHMHSTFSDGSMTIPELVDFYGSRGFGAIAITDHLCEKQTFLGKAAVYLKKTLDPAILPLYLAIINSETERAWDQYRMVVIPGFELTKNSVSNHRSAHILALGINQYLSAEGDVLDVVRRVRGAGALAVAAHPVSTRKVEKQTYHLWDRRDELAKEFDAWEVASGPYLFDEVMETRLPKIASSDLHVRSQISSWKTVFHCERHPEAIFSAIRKQELGFQFWDDPATGMNDYRRNEVRPNEYRHWFDVGGLGYRIGSDTMGNMAHPSSF